MDELRIAFTTELMQFSHFHKRLQPEEQVLFEEKAWRFFTEKQFEAVGFPEVSLRMKVIISSYAAQITFGYDDVLLKQFHTVVVHPAAYISKKVGTLVRGETSSRGVIQLSWLDIAEGHNNHNNGVNLALHEFAHALDIDNQMEDGDFQFLDPQSLLAFKSLAHAEMEVVGNGNHHFFRKYAATNMAEFFAVAVENFFERPVEMERELPELFEAMVELLKLNPCNALVRVFE